MYINRIHSGEKADGPQDLTVGYTKVGSSIDVSASRADFNNVYSNANNYLYKDFGSDHFNKIDLVFTLCPGWGANWGTAGLGFANNIATRNNWTGTSLPTRFLRNNTTGKLYLTFGEGGDYEVTQDALYYCRIYRAAGSDSATLYVYSDSARTTLLWSVTKTGLGTTKWRYFYAGVNDNNGDGGSRIYGHVKNYVFR